MTIREKQLTSAFALVGNAKSTLSVAMQLMGNLRYSDNNFDIHDDFLNAFRGIDTLAEKLYDLVDANTDFSTNGIINVPREKEQR